MGRRTSSYRRRKRRTSGLNLLLAVNKPYGHVTRAVDNFVGKVLNDDGIGHVGTLDPSVTGVLVLGVGQAKKLIPYLEEGRQKRYRARISFGSQTNTDDAEGTVMRTCEIGENVRDRAFAEDIVASYVGVQMQRPPMFSAIKVNGVRSYDRARAGEVFELPERQIEIYEATLNDIDLTDGVVWDVDFLVSPGTYIRALARDMGTAVGSAAHLQALCRTSAGTVGLEDCITLEQLEELGPERIASAALNPVAALGLSAYALTAEELNHVQNGRKFPYDETRMPQKEERVALVRQGLLYGIWEREGALLRSCANCPSGVSGVVE